MWYEMALTQKKLNRYILKKQKIEGTNFYEQKKMALLVELGELANELKFFKYWKVDTTPNTDLKCEACNGSGLTYMGDGNVDDCTFCEATGRDESVNPTLVEYVDVLHFLLTITTDRYVDDKELRYFLSEVEPMYYPDLLSQFSALYYEVANGAWTRLDIIWRYFLGLGELLGFSLETIEDAYYAKNKVNFERQDNNY